MPRRISDYPDAFAGWNLISSLGSIVSVVAAWLFLHIVYLQLIEGKTASRFPWMTPQFHTDTLQALISRSYPSLEWALSSPPKPHAFVSLPLQSSTPELVTCTRMISNSSGILGNLAEGMRDLSHDPYLCFLVTVPFAITLLLSLTEIFTSDALVTIASVDVNNAFPLFNNLIEIMNSEFIRLFTFYSSIDLAALRNSDLVELYNNLAELYNVYEYFLDEYTNIICEINSSNSPLVQNLVDLYEVSRRNGDDLYNIANTAKNVLIDRGLNLESNLIPLNDT